MTLCPERDIVWDGYRGLWLYGKGWRDENTEDYQTNDSDGIVHLSAVGEWNGCRSGTEESADDGTDL